MKISILLPYKENFTPNYAGAVSLFLNDTIRLSKYKKNIQVYGNTSFKKKLLKNYTNLKFTKFFFRSNSKAYVKKFLDEEKIKKSNLIEIHNRPEYINSIYKKNKNIVLYFHNNPLDMKFAKTLNERIKLYNKTKKIIFNSNWTLKQFTKGLNKKYNTDKLEVINQSTSKKIVNFKNKKK